MATNDNIELLERYFEGKANRQEIELLLQRMNKPEFEQTSMRKRWDETSFTMNPTVQKQIFENITAIVAPKRSLNVKKWIAVAASIVVLLTTSLSVYLLHLNSQNLLLSDMKFQVEKGQKASLILPDGSKVWINSGSTLTYGSRYNQKERIINLDGEAYFEVAPNKRAPFIVQSHGFSVKALGTAFDVKAYGEDKQFSTALVHGKVEVNDGNEKLYLRPNQKIIYDRVARQMVKRDVEDSNIYASWRDNQLVFESETFENIALVLERNYNVKLVFESEFLKGCHYSGSLANTSLSSILQIFAVTSPLSYKIKDSVIYLSENTKMIPYYDDVTSRNTNK
ncbi:MAG: putative anti-sigma factor [Bacteroidetes bacterium]|nr:putative anti-sigma factor [Bacteroidota bacterium]